MKRARLLALAIALAAGCGEGAGAGDPIEIEIGIPDVTRRRFEPLDADGTVYYSKGAQVQEFIMLAVRAKGVGPKAFVDVTVTLQSDGSSVAREVSEAPDTLDCTDGWCALVPILLPASALGELSQLEGAAIAVDAAVSSEAGGRGLESIEGVLKFR